jgi:putative hydrolase of the HAD superfamily
VSDLGHIEAITFDFYNTLVFHRDGRGRGRLLVEYLVTHGFRPAPWEHAVLYDVFETHDAHYSPEASQEARDEYYARLAQRVFRRLELGASERDAPRHATALWEILGPACLGVFPEVAGTLQDLRGAGYPLALISNWQCGLRHFCTELGLSEHFDHILGSADLGVAKPDVRIFAHACERLGVAADRVLHVGDTLEDDYLGGRSAGLSVALLARDEGSEPAVARVISSLAEVRTMLPGQTGQ